MQKLSPFLLLSSIGLTGMFIHKYCACARTKTNDVTVAFHLHSPYYKMAYCSVTKQVIKMSVNTKYPAI